MKAIKDYPVSELKQIYQILHQQIQDNPELMDSELLQDLQTLLHSLASTDGVDIALHSEWSAWLSKLPTS